MTSWFTDMVESASVLFNEDFDDLDQRHLNVAQEEFEKFSTDDLATCRKEGWDEGFVAGREEGLTELHTEIRTNIAMIAAEMRTAMSDFMTKSERIGEELAGVLVAALGNILPTLCAHYGSEEIAAVVAEILPSMGGEPRLCIQIAPDRVLIMREILTQYSDDIVDNIDITTNPKLGSSDIVVRWHHGEAVRNVDAMWRNILAILAPYGLQPASVQMNTTTKEPVHVQ